MADTLHIDNTFGAMYIGVVIAATLYGVSCIQAWYFFDRYSHETWYLKLLVGTVFVCDSMHQLLISHTLYIYLVTNFANIPELGKLVWSLVVEVLFNGFVGLLVQSFFAYRIYQLSNKNIPLSALVFLLVLAEFGVTLTYASKALKMTTFDELATLKALSMSVNALAAAGDVLIAISMVFLLHSSRTGFKKSDSVINKLIVFSLNTGLLTSLCAVLSLITIATLPTTFVYICFYFMLGRLYSNSLLATLNARKRLRGDGVPETSTASYSMHRLRGRPMTTATNKGGTEIAIKIDTTKEYAGDGYPGSEVLVYKPGEAKMP